MNDMTSQTRRGVLKSLGALVSVAPFGFFTSARLGAASADALERKTTAITVMRFINTVQLRNKTHAGGYVPVWDLPSAPSAQPLLAERAREFTFDRTGGLIEGLQAYWALSQDRTQYEVALIDPETNLGVFSEQSGTIYTGSVTLPVRGGSGKSLQSQFNFIGRPLGQDRDAARPLSLIARIAGLIVPTVYAFRAVCCSGAACACQSGSGCGLGLHACNVGFGGDCNWCCVLVNKECVDCVPDGCTIPPP